MAKRSPSFFSQLPATVRYDKKISMTEKVLFSEITALTFENGYCNAKNSYFADRFELNVATISVCINKLFMLGYLFIQNVKGERRLIPNMNCCVNLQNTRKKAKVSLEYTIDGKVCKGPCELHDALSNKAIGERFNNFTDKNTIPNAYKIINILSNACFDLNYQGIKIQNIKMSPSVYQFILNNFDHHLLYKLIQNVDYAFRDGVESYTHYVIAMIVDLFKSELPKYIQSQKANEIDSQCKKT